MINVSFYNQDPCVVAKQLLGKVIRHRCKKVWLAARIIETEAYYMDEKGSHSSLGYTEKRKAMFMPPGTIYMYYARGGDSMNISVKGTGNAVLIKAGYPYMDEISGKKTLSIMQKLNPVKGSGKIRTVEKLCAGQTLLCKALDIKVSDWDQKQFDPDKLYIEDTGIRVTKIIQTHRLGIPEGRDHHLMYRFIDYDYARFCTSNPLTKRNFKQDRDYKLTGIS
ncbi:MAG: DNA-3-methyladenine glycosylase [Gammaproteobacteria bacterium]|nr:DNA-3-methyladenine glycosylase [Gammaproteobacteria bacterium]